ncbi:UNVERIFIED_CONTAM: hypothetical protein HDU68_010909 [Siphonaria sp. JEL0065]|nr:hypothetical protein HDU68_010909 [Siphonaria sp. JEL0065]
MKFLLAVAMIAAAAPKHLTTHGLKGGALNIVDLLEENNASGLRVAAAPSNVAPAGLPTISGFYKQTVDHFGNQKGINGTHFDQLYFIQDAYYKPGGPVFFFIAGEGPATDGWMKGGYGSILSHLMPRYNGMVVSLEHRFYGAGADPSNPGRSVPTADLSPESLKLLNANQAIEDMASFITDFPTLFPKYNMPKDTKWITIGGSYPGSLSAWMRQQHPELVYAAHASSAPVQLQMDFWKYSYAVDEGIKFWADVKYKTGQACVNGWTRAVKLFDNGLTEAAKDPAALKAFKSKFWLSQVNALSDVGSNVASDFGSTVQYYPENDKVGGKTRLEVVCGKDTVFTNPKATDAELLKALQDFTILKLTSYGITGDEDPNVGLWFNTVASTDYSFEAVGPWLWYYQSCNEMGYAQVAQPLTKQGLIESWSVYSQFNTVASYEKWCRDLGFTKASTIPAINANNQYYGGLWNYQSNILFTNGELETKSLLGKTHTKIEL